MVSIDYCYFGASRADLERIEGKARERDAEGAEAIDDEVPKGSVPTLVVYDSETKAPYSFAVSRKGPAHDAVVRLTEALDDVGHRAIILKSNQEPAIKSLVAAVKTRWNGSMVVEEAPAYTPQANGAAERSVRTLRSMDYALDLLWRIGSA